MRSRFALSLLSLVLASPALADNPGARPILGIKGGGTGSDTASGALNNLSGLPHVASNAALKALAAGQYAAVARDGFYTPGDGGAATYVWSSSACTLGSGLGDNGMQVKPTTGSGCWVLSASGYVDVRVWGARAHDGSANPPVNTVINTAVNNSPSVGGLGVSIPAGLTFVTRGIVMKSNSRLRIDGKLVLPSAVNETVISIVNNADNILIDGLGVIDQNGYDKINNSAGGGISTATTASNITIRDLTIQNTAYWGINLVGVTNCSVTNVTINGSYYANEFAAGTNNCWARGLRINDTRKDGSFVFYKGVWDSGITDSVITNGYVLGVGVFNDNDTQNVSHDILIANNIIRKNGRVGIEVSTGVHDDETKNHYNIKVRNNVLVENGWLNESQGDLALSAIEKSDVSGNSSYAYGGTAMSPAIKILRGSNTLTVTNNTLVNPGPGGTAGVCIRILLGSGDYISVNNNTCIDNQAVKTTAYGFSGAVFPPNSVIYNNTVVGTIYGFSELNANGGFGPLSANQGATPSTMPYEWKNSAPQIAGLNFYGSANVVTALQYNGVTDTLTFGGADGKPANIYLSAAGGGKVVMEGAQHDGGAVFVASASVTAGATRTPAAGKDRLILMNTSVVASQTIKLPPITGVSGQMFWMSSIGGITALTVKDNNGNVIANSPTTLAAGVGRAMITDGANWFTAQ
jgi:hypothetical protein